MKFNQTTSKSSVWIVLSNDFHNTNIRLRARSGDTGLYLTPSQVKHAKRMLCGISDCTCGDTFGCRGKQPFADKYVLIPTANGGAEIEIETCDTCGSPVSRNSVEALWNADEKHYETRNGWLSEDGNNWVDSAIGGPVMVDEFAVVSIRRVNGPRHGEIVG